MGAKKAAKASKKSSEKGKASQEGKEACRVRPECKHACGGVLWLRILRCNHFGPAPRSPERLKPIERAIVGLIPHELWSATTLKIGFQLGLHPNCREQCDAL